MSPTGSGNDGPTLEERYPWKPWVFEGTNQDSISPQRSRQTLTHLRTQTVGIPIDG